MTDPRRQAFAPYFRQLANLMGLWAWAIAIDDDPEEEANARAHLTRGRYRVLISLSEGFLRSSPEDQRQTACHELIHAHMAAMHFVVTDAVSTDAEQAYVLAMEYAVDAMATEWAKTMPLPYDGEPVAKPKRPKTKLARK